MRASVPSASHPVEARAPASTANRRSASPSTTWRAASDPPLHATPVTVPSGATIRSSRAFRTTLTPASASSAPNARSASSGSNAPRAPTRSHQRSNSPRWYGTGEVRTSSTFSAPSTNSPPRRASGLSSAVRAPLSAAATAAAIASGSEPSTTTSKLRRPLCAACCPTAGCPSGCAAATQASARSVATTRRPAITRPPPAARGTTPRPSRPRRGVRSGARPRPSPRDARDRSARARPCG